MEAGGVKIEEIQGRGRGVVACQALKAGEIILRDSPILLYSAGPLSPSFPFPDPQQQQQHHHYCSHCFTIISPSASSALVSSCPSCYEEEDNNKKVLFCSPNCQSTAATTSHTPWVCHALIRLRHALSQHPEELQVQARFLVAAYNLAIVSPSHFHTLLSLQGGGGGGGGGVGQQGVAVLLHSLISSLCPPPLTTSTSSSFCLDLTAALLAKDKLNAFGLMEPPFTAGDGEVIQDSSRSVRAYGIYPNASLFNHDCLPNACRFDYIDRTATTTSNSSRGSNTDIIIRMIHDVPQGREICLSYFPVNLNYRDRQLRLKDDYGFICSCDRCQVEANWSFSDDDDDRDEELMDDDDGDELMEAGEEEDGNNMVMERNESGSDFPHAYFFLRYVCTRQNCWGTLAPLPAPPSPNGTTTPSSSAVMMECNVCGSIKNDEQEQTNADACVP